MKGCDQPGGFTIMEVMIVLAVSAILFLAAALMIAGKQNRTGFTTSIYDFKTEMQQVANDVANGYYPKESGFGCTQGSGNPPNNPPTLQYPGSNSQGQNGGLTGSDDTLSGCVFLGKAVQFSVGSASSPSIDIYPVIGNLESGGGSQPSQGLYNSYPELLAAGNSPTTNGGFSTSEFTQTYVLNYGLYVSWMCYSLTSSPCTSANPSNTGVVIFATGPSASSTGMNLSSATQQVEFVPVPFNSYALGSDSPTAVGAVDNYLLSNANGASPNLNINPAGGIEICVADQTTTESGLLTIGGDSSQPTINLKISLGNLSCS